jgi:hypothetical protein
MSGFAGTPDPPDQSLTEARTRVVGDLLEDAGFYDSVDDIDPLAQRIVAAVEAIG